jgi:hypothetical protein
MTKSTLVITTIATVLAMGACAKKDHKSPMDKADPKVDSPATVDARNAQAAANTVSGDGTPTLRMSGKANQAQQRPPGATRPSVLSKEIDFALTETFEGSFLTLAYPNDGNWGWIHIDDEDAKALFDSLRVKAVATEKNETYAAGTSKTGENIRCFKGAELKTPTVDQYSCAIYIDYKKGSANLLQPHVEFDGSVPALTEKYMGTTLNLNPAGVVPSELGDSAPLPLGTLRFSGPDARALFSTLNVAAVMNAGQELELDPTALIKRGQSISCTKAKPVGAKADSYNCALGFNFATGKVAAAQGSALDVSLSPEGASASTN